MHRIIDSNSGIYILELYAKDSFRINIKKFQDVALKSGFYYYVGSAQKNLSQRIDRHFKTEKKIHWHIDHLTTNKNVVIKNVFVVPNASKRLEEDIANIFPSIFKGEILLKSFGNSDTKGSITHLFYRVRPIPYNHFSDRYQSIVLFNPSSKENF